MNTQSLARGPPDRDAAFREVTILRVIRYARYGDPQEVVEVVDQPPLVPGPGEVVIALEAAPVHLADLKNIAGQPWFRAPLPAVPGYEGVGRIKSVGTGVSNVALADRVFLPTGLGAWREEFLAPAAGLWRAPEAVAAEQLALIPINLQTAYLMLREDASLRPGDWIIQNAANSNVGYYVIRLARRFGLRTINVARRAEVLSGLDDAGGDIALLDGDDLAERVVRTGQNVRLAIDAVAGSGTARLADCLGPGGRIVNYGFLTSDICAVPAQQMMFRQITLSGFFTKASMARMDDAAIAGMREELTAFLHEDVPAAPIAGVYPFSRVHDALAHAACTGDGREGKVVLVP